jgi:acyl dehydratase
VTLTYDVEAFNTATRSHNKIHDDAIARDYGFRGGLVPGVDVYAYMTHVPAARWGADWLRGGTMSARFVQPVYDGERVTVTGTLERDTATAMASMASMAVTVSDADGEVRATGRACRTRPLPPRPVPGRAPLPTKRPPASAESLPPGRVLGSLDERFDPERAQAYLADVREGLSLYANDSIAHPGWVLRFANTILSSNVELGPWIHVSSDVTMLGLIGAGQSIDVRGAVVDEYERKGHRFVALDVAVLADEVLVQRIAHTAIHTPRRVER